MSTVENQVLPAVGRLRFLATKELSKEITGNGVGGDDSIIWDRRFSDQIKEAQDAFDKLVSKGYSAFLADGTKLRSFDPEAEEIVMVCPAVGG